MYIFFILFIYYTFQAIKSNDFRLLGPVHFMAMRCQRRWSEQINWLLTHLRIYITNNSATFRYFQLLFSIAKSICAIIRFLSAPTAAFAEWIPCQFRRILTFAGLLPGTASVHRQRKCQTIASGGQFAIRNSIWRQFPVCGKFFRLHHKKFKFNYFPITFPYSARGRSSSYAQGN